MDCGLIGNGAFQALIDGHGQVVWMCLPRFDSSFVFGSLISGDDSEAGGAFAIEIAGRQQDTVTKFSQVYVEKSATLKTTLSAGDDAIEIRDFAPLSSEPGPHLSTLVRRIRILRGRPKVRIRCDPRTKYGLGRAAVKREGKTLRWALENLSCNLEVGTHAEDVAHSRWFELEADLDLVFSWSEETETPLASADALETLTHNFWRAWLETLSLPTVATEHVERSAITLKLHQYAPTGAFTAATTTSIPEYPKSGRTWDYRYYWPRDAFFSVRALVQLGRCDELTDYLKFVTELLVEKHGQTRHCYVQPLYRINGDLTVDEQILDHLAGFQGDGPVRIGNDAYLQHQFDVYGELLATAALALEFGDESATIIGDFPLDALLRAAKQSFAINDAGPWEKRDTEVAYAFTHFAHWLAGTSFERMGQASGDLLRESEGRAFAKLAAERLEEYCYRSDLKRFAESERCERADGSLFLMPSLGFFDGNEERGLSHVESLFDELDAGAGLVYRYIHDDGLGQTHAAFLVCSFWMVESLAKLGHKSRAEKIFNTLLTYGNHLGLFSEDLDPNTHEPYGNFPQTYSHAGLISAAIALSK